MLAILLALALTQAAETPARPSVYASPTWVRLPKSVDIARVYPRDALARRIGGKVIIGCKVTVKGTLSECAVVTEEPGGMGFGDAALSLAPLFRMRPQANGKSVEGARVRIPITFTP